MKLLFAMISLIILSLSSCKKTQNITQTDKYEKFWIQYSDNNNLLFRYLSNNQQDICPEITVDSTQITTSKRDHISYLNEFPVLLCQAIVNDSSKEHIIIFRENEIHSKIKDISKISVVGDTGCIVENTLIQNCNSLEEYPFPSISKEIANDNPDLIIHVGDYYYSNIQCPKNELKCLNRSYGDNFETWKVDFLNSAEQFFSKAPIIFTRGNHENCERGGKGWAVLFDPSENFQKCNKHNKPYSIEIDKIRFLVLDSAYAIDSERNIKSISDQEYKSRIEKYKDDFDVLTKGIDDSKQNILITHKPVFSKEQRPWEIRNSEIYDLNYTLNQAIKENALNEENTIDNINMILSGHTHTSALIDLNTINSKKHIYQLVAGNGGAFLYKFNLFKNENNEPYTTSIGQKDNIKDNKIFDLNINSIYRHKEFGYNNLLLENDEITKVEFKTFDNRTIETKNLIFKTNS